MLSRNLKKTDEKKDQDEFYVTFNLGNEEYGIPIGKIQEVILVNEIIPVPKAPVYMAGIMKMRDAIITMINLRVRFNIAAEEGAAGDTRRAIVIHLGTKPIGLIVDKVNKVIKFREDIEPAPPTIKGINAANIMGIGKYEDRFIILLNIDTILSRDELKDFEEQSRNESLF